MKPQIVVVDGYLMNSGSFSWDELRARGSCQIYDRTPKNLVIERCEGADIVVTNKVVFSKEVIRSLPKLKYIGVSATGYNNVDLAAALGRGIVVTNVPAYSTPSVAQHVFALLLEITNQVGLHNQAVHSHEWETAPDFAFWKAPLIELDSLTLGIIGYGEIGKTVAKIGKSFGMHVKVHSRSQKDPSVEYVDLNTLLRISDVITLHCPLTEETRHIINERTLSQMKPSAILINTSRGPLIDERALSQALSEKKIFAAALDVLEKEPADPQCPLLRLKNCFITPHIAWATVSARKRLFSTVLRNIQSYLTGSPQNIIRY